MTTITKTSGMLVALCVALAPAAASPAAEVGGAIEVAPGVESTRSQMWPRAAWSEGAGCWLVAWREGPTNEFAADIWCARVSADGKALDPQGIRVCAAAENQERPWVASDGKGFLVVWEDFRNGKDYDVYAARVSAEGKVLDQDGFLVAGGEHNQCHPAASFAGGNYYVAWQAFAADPGRYLLHGARVSAEGKVLDAEAALLTPPGGDGDPVDGSANACDAVVAAAGDRILVGHLITARGDRGKGQHGAIVPVDASTGQAQGKAAVLGPGGRGGMIGFATNATQNMPALAWGGEGGLFAAPCSKGGGVGESVAIWLLDGSGKDAGPPRVLAAEAGARFSPLFSIAFDGNRYLVTMDRPERQGPGGRQIMKVFGLSIPSDGKPLTEGKGAGETLAKAVFLIAGDDDRDQMQGYACAGPKGTCLVTCVEIRPEGDLKVLARVVK